jgi:uncharacterized membrane protein YuzA (DUF378 family)
MRPTVIAPLGKVCKTNWKTNGITLASSTSRALLFSYETHYLQYRVKGSQIISFESMLCVFLFGMKTCLTRLSLIILDMAALRLLILNILKEHAEQKHLKKDSRLRDATHSPATSVQELVLDMVVF